MFIIFLLICLFTFSNDLNCGKPVIFRTDNGEIGGSYTSENQIDWEESIILTPPGPCKINKLFVLLTGNEAKPDTLWLLNDAAYGAHPPTEFSWMDCPLMEPIIYNYTGKPGWFEFDIENYNLRADGLTGIVVQHIIKVNGPYFIIDGDNQGMPYNSWLCDVWKKNPNYDSLRGTIYSPTVGNYMIRMEVEYDYPKDSTSAPAPTPQLVDVTKEAGLTYNNGSFLQIDAVSVFDYNNDGFDDVIAGNLFFKNMQNGKFAIDSINSNIYKANYTVWADIDNDGLQDFFAVNGDGNDLLYYGKSDGTFEEWTALNLKVDAPTVTPLFFDYDNDGLLDIYIDYGKRKTDTYWEFFQDKLFKNLGNRKFKEVTKESNIAVGEPSPYYDSYGASLTDYNNDGKTDIFVTTYMLMPDLLFKNNNDGTFDEVAKKIGVHGVPTYTNGYYGQGMGSDWGDFDNDGDLDLAVGNMSYTDERAINANPSLIFENMGNDFSSFNNITYYSKLKFYEQSGAPLWVDLDNDSYLDLLHCQTATYQKGKDVNHYAHIYKNTGADGNFKFQDLTWELGALIHGAATASRIDYDNDGDMDLLISSNRDRLFLFRNDVENKGNFISFRLTGNPERGVNSNAYGSSVTVYGSKGGKYYRALPGTILTGLTAQNTNELHFGLGDAQYVDSVLIKFVNDSIIKLYAPKINKKYSVKYDSVLVSVNENNYNNIICSYTAAPNPCVNEINFSFELKQASLVEINVYDSKAGFVGNICSDELLPNSYNFKFDTQKLTDGLYYCYIKTKNNQSIYKFVKIK